MPSRRRLASHAAVEALARGVLRIGLADQEQTWSRTSPSASPISVSAAPSPYISAVSMRVMPSSTPARSAAISPARRSARSPIIQVPWPSAGTLSPSGSDTVFIGLPSCDRTPRISTAHRGHRSVLDSACPARRPAAAPRRCGRGRHRSSVDVQRAEIVLQIACAAWCRGSARCRRPAPAPRRARAARACSPCPSPSSSIAATRSRFFAERLALEARVVAAAVAVGRDRRAS